MNIVNWITWENWSKVEETLKLIALAIIIYFTFVNIEKSTIKYDNEKKKNNNFDVLKYYFWQSLMSVKLNIY